MRLLVTYDPEIYSGAWPGPLGERDAVVGEVWFGPLGLLGRLETELGLGGIYAAPIERAVDLAEKLGSSSGWWRESYDADPIGTAQRLLRDRDMLALWGWQGEPASERLGELWRATQASLPGIPDRLRNILSALASRSVELARVVLTSPRANEPTLWREVFSALETRGVLISEAFPKPAPASGDLAAARAPGFTPRGDGSLVLLRNHGALAAAEEVAAWLSTISDLRSVLIIGADEVLDSALARHNLPRVGGLCRAPASTRLLRLVIEAAFAPADPRDLHALIAMDPGPIPRRIGSRLLDALNELPGRQSTAWIEALEEGLSLCDEDFRDSARARCTLLAPLSQRGEAISVEALTARLQLLSQWARARAQSSDSLFALAAGTEQLRKLTRGKTSLSLAALRRLCDEVEASFGAMGDAHSGLHSVASPGAVLGAVPTIVWWSFTRDSAPPPLRLRLSMKERAALGAAAPDLSRLAEARAAAWRRPLEYASERLVLVCPTTSSTGERCFPHPLWDELHAGMAHTHLIERRSLPDVRRKAAPSRALPVASTQVNVGRAIALRDKESPSSIERLLGCSFAWTLHYHAHLDSGLSAGPGVPTPLLYGKLAHALIAKVFADGKLGPAEAEARAREIVDTELDNLCETLALPRYQVQRTQVKRAIVDTARAVGALLERTGASVRGVEMEIAGTLEGVPIAGRADFVMQDPHAILDFKWGLTSTREKLQSDTSIQLALYARLSESQPDVAYLVLKTQALLAHRGTKLPQARTVGSASAQEVVAAALVSLATRREQLEDGVLLAPSADGTVIKPRLENGKLTIEPPCKYCELGGICGTDGAK